MAAWVRIKNLGQICEVMGSTGTGALVLKNPQAGRNEVFHPNAVEPVPHGQYCYCWMCFAPVLLEADPDKLSHHHCCSESCWADMRDHYS